MTESGRIKILTFGARYQHFKSLHYVYIRVVDPPRIVFVWLCPIGDKQGCLPQISIRQAPHCDLSSPPETINNLYYIELGHKSRDQWLFKNIKH